MAEDSNMHHHISGFGRTVVSSAALALVLTACSTSGSGGGDGSGGGGGADSSSKGAKGESSPSAGVISLKSAQGVLLNYAKVNNQANAAQDPKKIAEVESGALLQQSQATFTQFTALPKKEQASYEVPFYYPVKGAHFYIPRKGSESVFWADTRVTGKNIAKDRRRLIAFKHVKGGEGAAWKAVAVGELDDKLPEIQRDGDGFASVLKASDTVGKTKLDDLRGWSQDFYVTGGKNAGSTFADTAAVKDWKKEYTNRADFPDGCVDGKYNPGRTAAETVYGLKTADGGAVALYDFGVDYVNWPKTDGLQCESVMRIDNMPAVTDIYLDGRTTSTILTRSDSLLTMAVVPPSGKRVRVTGYSFQLINAKG
ncbi:hypothetical protein [Streptomyces sp. ME19-01-6]|uniref:hypothetical protein n=1 Tax=Streptomyces sp. ME19-01-6 TaxID=3028686 RepID=UPI0029B21573|nr:hypothetical protein [Streptomyces sp. ME19-01-6]MDX3225047.1 hypothetical protein [Streptomyces sp. ME19-01-6]